MSGAPEEPDPGGDVSEAASADWDDPVLQRLAHAPSLRPPSEFTGTERYEVRRVLGSGGFGTVYEARDRRDGSVVALKVLRVADPAGVSRFKHEFRSLADVTHPNLVRLDELVLDGDLSLIVMELVRGAPFDVFVAGSPPRLRAAALGLAEGLSALHEAGKLHRDVKPSNVLVEEGGRVVLLDFGLVLDAGDSRVGEIAGTPRYMAPERLLRSAPPGEAGDLYAMGVMLHEALAGCPPIASAARGGAAPVHGDGRAALTDPLEAAPPDLRELCRALLDPVPERRPTARQVRDRLRGAPTSRSELPQGTFVGRATELAGLADALDRVRRDGPRVLLVVGEPGVGKSAFLEAAERTLRASHPELAWLGGRCRERESVPYKALDGVVDALALLLTRLPEEQRRALLPRDGGDLVRQFPVFATLLPFQEPSSGGLGPAMAALRELVGRLSDARPLVIALDDLQWGDADSATVLAELLRPPRAPGVLYVGTCRRGEAAGSALLAGLSASLEVAWTEIPLSPLSDDRATELTRALAGARLGDGDVARVVREARGNPLFVRELVLLSELQPGATAPTLAAGIGQRVAALPDAARRFLEATAVADHPEPAGAVARAAEVSDVRAVVGTLRAQQLVRLRDAAGAEAVECYHDRIRETVCASLSPARVAALHAALAGVLAGSGAADAAAERIARHFASAGRADDAAAFAIAAARRAAGSFAYDHARELLGLALEMVGSSDPRTWELKRDLGDVLAASGRGGEAADAFLAAARTAPEEQGVDLRRRAASTLLATGHVDRGLSVLGSVMKELDLWLPRSSVSAVLALVPLRARIRLRGLSVVARSEADVPRKELWRVDALRGAALGLIQTFPAIGGVLAAKHFLLALELGVPDRVLPALALEAIGSAFGGSGARERTRELLSQAQLLADEIGEPSAQAWSLFARTIAAFMQGRWVETEAIADELLSTRPDSRATASRTWPDLNRDLVRGLRLNAMYMRVLPGDVERELPALIQDLTRRGNRLGLLWMTGYRVFTLACRGRAPEARALLAHAMKEWAVVQFHMQSWWEVLGTVHIDLYEGKAQAAWDAMSRVWPALQRSFVLGDEFHRIEARWLRARAALALALAVPGGAEEKRLLRIVEGECSRIEREGAIWGKGLAGTLRAGVASIRGDASGAELRLAEAIPLLTAHRIDGVIAIAERARGRLRGGSEGEALVQRSEAWMASQDVAEPSRFSEMYLPGRW